MPMLTLYASPTDPTADAIARTLELLAVPCVRRDPAADPSAAAQLRALTGELTTPTPDAPPTRWPERRRCCCRCLACSWCCYC